MQQKPNTHIAVIARKSFRSKNRDKEPIALVSVIHQIHPHGQERHSSCCNLVGWLSILEPHCKRTQERHRRWFWQSRSLKLLQMAPKF